MLVLGLVLILFAAGSFVAVLASGTDDKAVLYGGSVEMPTLVVFLAGALALLIVVLGVELVRSGVRRANQNRQTKKRLRKLEQREQLRRQDETAEGRTAGPAGTTSADAAEDTRADTGADTSHDTSPETRPDNRPDAGTDPGTHTGTGTDPAPGATGESGSHARTDGPYQAPPPPSR
jgi:hypothetical protein